MRAQDAQKKAAGGSPESGAAQGLLGASPAASAGKAAAGGSNVINLTATAVGAHWAGEGGGGAPERVDMRPNSVTVRVVLALGGQAGVELPTPLNPHSGLLLNTEQQGA